MRTLPIAAAALLLAGGTAQAQDRTAAIDSIFRFATQETPGCAVGVSRDGTVLVNKAYGLANLEQRTPLGPRSLFDIGSTQKQFTAASVLLLAEEGRLSLADDIRKHLPELADYGHTVTVDHLLTHTGGIRDWTGLLPLAPEGTDVATLLPRQRGLNFEPGTEWAYSNGGYELAKTLVARVSGMSFAEFTRRRIFEPLGMKSTAYVPDILHAGSDAALGYRKDGQRWEPYMRLGNNRGGGAIVSTIGDLLTWQEALADGKLGASVTAKLHEPVRLRNGRQLQYARGLRIDSTPGGTVIGHSGGAAGFSTFMGRVPEHRTAFAVACNFDPVSATGLAGRAADVFLPPPDSQALARDRARRPVAMSGVDVAPRAGLYFDERGEPIRLGVNNGRLMIANGPPLVAVSATSFRPPRPDLFFRSADDFTLTFVDPDRFEIRSMEGEVTRYRRAQPYTPTADELQALDGRYESPELGSVFEVLPGDSRLVMRFESTPERALELEPVARDTWMRSLMIVRFHRDAAGRVTGFTYSNPVAKGIAFTRLGERRTAAAQRATSTQVTVSKAPAAGTPATAGAQAPRLEALTGEYELAPGRTLAVTLENGQLHGQPPGSEKRALTLVSGTTFSVANAPMTLTFTVDAAGNATGIVMRQGERERTLRKVK